MKSVKKSTPTSAREACFLALKTWNKEAVYLADFFHYIRKKEILDHVDLSLAQEIAFGVVRRYHTIDAILKKILTEQKIRLKVEPRLILKMAVYQLVFMDKVPVYAVVFESVELCKKYCPYQAAFINGILRKLTPLLPIKDFSKWLDLEEIYSVPKTYVEKLKLNYPKSWQGVLEASIQRPKMTFLDLSKQDNLENYHCVFKGFKLRYYALKKEESSAFLFQSQQAYIQNPTPGALIEAMAIDFYPESFIDVCAAPGGKTILLNYIYPEIKIAVNEISQERSLRLKENLFKYKIETTIFHQDASIIETENKYDLIVVDAPCSNSGVLHKKPEAKFRLEQKNLDELKETQFKILENSIRNLKPCGQIWYLTCSILKEENEEQINKFLNQFNDFSLKHSLTILPDLNYFDGGFCAALQYNP